MNFKAYNKIEQLGDDSVLLSQHRNYLLTKACSMLNRCLQNRAEFDDVL